MPNIMPITDLRKTNEISDLCHKSQEPVFITKNGYGDLVVMSIEAYEKLVRDISNYIQRHIGIWMEFISIFMNTFRCRSMRKVSLTD